MIPLFVYGSLKPGGQYWADFCENRVEQVCTAAVRGCLYDLPLGYPALVAAGSRQPNWVQGYLLQIKEASDLARIDRLEGYQPQSTVTDNEYNRCWVSCYNPSLSKVISKAWAYEMSAKRVRLLRGCIVKNGQWPLR